MATANDLTEREFGFLKVLKRDQDHVTKSGQKKVMWLCECKLCGSHKSVSAQDLKNGKVVSCGCYRAHNGKLSRNKKICVVCGREFECPPSDKTVTCSQECRKERVRRNTAGKKLTEETRKKLSEKSKGRDMAELQEAAVEAAKASPKSGRFTTNVNAKDWHLISPSGKHYHFRSLSHWLRENGQELFGCEPDSREWKNVCTGLGRAKSAMLGGTYRTCTYKDWNVIPTNFDCKRKGENYEHRSINQSNGDGRI